LAEARRLFSRLGLSLPPAIRFVRGKQTGYASDRISNGRWATVITTSQLCLWPTRAGAGAMTRGALKDRDRNLSSGFFALRVVAKIFRSLRRQGLVDGIALMEIGLLDLTQAFRRLPVALFFAWSDTKARYKRSFLGPFWLVLTTMVGVIGMGYIWSILLRIDRAEFIPSLTIGLIVWQLISGCISESASVFYRQATQIKNINLPSFFLSIQLVFRHLINFGHNIVIFAIVMAIYPEHASLTAVLGAPGLILVLLNLLWLIQVLGYLGARYRDLEPLIVASLPILFFLSPVVYRASQLGKLASVMAFNPLTYWIGLIRDPLLGTIPSIETYVLAVVVTVAGWAAALWLTGSRRHRLPYWI
jgi:ABC-type polysaccharide/polyol phosphate export permease